MFLPRDRNQDSRTSSGPVNIVVSNHTWGLFHGGWAGVGEGLHEFIALLMSVELQKLHRITGNSAVTLSQTEYPKVLWCFLQYHDSVSVLMESQGNKHITTATMASAIARVQVEGSHKKLLQTSWSQSDPEWSRPSGKKFRVCGCLVLNSGLEYSRHMLCHIGSLLDRI